MLWSCLLALVPLAHAAETTEEPAAETAVTTRAGADAPYVTLHLGAATEPVKLDSDGYAGRAAVQVHLARRLAIEWGSSVFTRRPTRSITQREPLQYLTGRLSDPVWTSDLRVQLGLVDGTVQLARRELPIALTVDLGGGAVRTRDDLDALQCASGFDTPCTATASQIHPALLVGSSLSVAPSERLRVRGVLTYRTWIEALDGTELVRIGSTTLGVDVGVRLGRISRQAPEPTPQPAL